ncbi:hypothetical protein SAMN05428950_102481 [Sphingomonas sp. OV641]|uniref:hypothetical protein n=1 Tax=Sphingomonas sp. OV641 TaxID=1881068 RepID=UPI0008AB7734|nr:hypothetical protein [Sphingomonas sp. OV641]SEJ66973.1 hypothetical protein SAMN05428950_102481 [Sphingomonas sp. OV641]
MTRLIEEPGGSRNEAPAGHRRGRGTFASALAAVLMTSGMLVAVAPPDDVNDAKRALTAQRPTVPAIDGIA